VWSFGGGGGPLLCSVGCTQEAMVQRGGEGEGAAELLQLGRRLCSPKRPFSPFKQHLNGK